MLKRQKLAEVQREIDESTVVLGDVNTPTRDGQIQGVENHKDTVELNNTSNELDTRDIY